MKMTGRHFAIYRMLLGTYLALYFFHLVPWAEELFGPEGMVPVPSSNVIRIGWFPNILALIPLPAAAPLFLTLVGMASLMLAAGLYRHAMAGLIWYGYACIIQRNAVVDNPAIGFVSWVVLATLLVPAGEPWSVHNRSREPVEGWSVSPQLLMGGWIVFGVAYTISGVDKILQPYWRSGAAFREFLDVPLHRSWGIHSWFRELPMFVSQVLTWAAVWVEILFLPAIFHPRARMIVWWLTVGLHLIVLLNINITMLTMGALISLGFLFDPEWIRKSSVRSAEVR